jgi:aryl-alcohol dehydrogenase
MPSPDLPELEADQILVRVVAVVVCHTGLASREGLLGAPFPAIFGHEGAGIVERTGSRVKKVVPGDHVVLAPASDGTCPQCQSGAPMYCDQFNALNFQAASSGPTATVADGTKVRIYYQNYAEYYTSRRLAGSNGARAALPDQDIRVWAVSISSPTTPMLRSALGALRWIW